LKTALHSERDEVTSELLSRFGLSDDEAAMFVLLSRINKDQTVWLKGSDISGISKKGRVRTYQILQRLLEIGVIRVDYSRPKRYSAVSPQVALRRLLSIEETKLNDLSHIESEAVESLLRLDPLNTEALIRKEESKSGSVVSLLQGLANIQVALRESMEDADLLISINDESAQHVLSTLNFLSKKPKSAKIILSTGSRTSVKDRFMPLKETAGIEFWWRTGDSPAFVLTYRVTMMLYYAKTSMRKKLLSPITTSTGVSQLVVVDSEPYSGQMRNLFNILLKDSRRVD
jgi:sugar-specific transcriptional regulator TrmB